MFWWAEYIIPILHFSCRLRCVFVYSCFLELHGIGTMAGTDGSRLLPWHLLLRWMPLQPQTFRRVEDLKRNFSSRQWSAEQFRRQQQRTDLIHRFLWLSPSPSRRIWWILRICQVDDVLDELTWWFVERLEKWWSGRYRLVRHWIIQRNRWQ